MNLLIPEDQRKSDLWPLRGQTRRINSTRNRTLIAFRATFRNGSGWPLTDSMKTMLMPDWLSRIHHPTDPDDVGPDPNCEHCGVPATCSHLVWNCAGSAPERKAAIRNLPYHIHPCSYTEWTKPTTAIPSEQKLVYTSLRKHAIRFVDYFRRRERVACQRASFVLTPVPQAIKCSTSWMWHLLTLKLWREDVWKIPAFWASVKFPSRYS